MEARLRGGVLELPSGAPTPGRSTAPGIAAALGELGAIGRAFGLSGLRLLSVNGRARTTVAAVRQEALVLTEVNGARGTSRVEEALEKWCSEPVTSATPALTQEAVFSGHLAVFSLPDLLEFLRTGRRTGVLRVKAGAKVGALRFRDGWLIGASSPTGTSAEWQTQERRGLPPVAPQEALRQQITLTLRELVQWKNGEFVFTREGVTQAEISDLVQVDPQWLLLDLFRELDEQANGRSMEGTH